MTGIWSYCSLDVAGILPSLDWYFVLRGGGVSGGVFDGELLSNSLTSSGGMHPNHTLSGQGP